MGQRIAINTAAGIASIKQVTRLAVLNTSADSRGINQRAHYSIDQFASSTGVPYSTIRPAIFSASLLAACERMELAASTSLHRLLQRDRVDEPDEFVDQNVEVNGAVHWLRNYGAGLRTVVEAFPNFPGISNTGSSTTAGSWVNGQAGRGIPQGRLPRTFSASDAIAPSRPSVLDRQNNESER
jgi:hypothetical protein